MNDPSFVWAEVDLSAIAHNVRELRRIIQPQAQLMVAVKANGYGHGAEAVATTALANGATQLGVARIEEAIDLRQAGIEAPILIFGYTPGHLAPELIRYDLMASVFSLHGARELNDQVPEHGSLSVHLKVDTGMGRLGMLPDERRVVAHHPDEELSAVDEVSAMAALDKLDLIGLWTHYASSDDRDKDFTRRQLARFKRFSQKVNALGVPIDCHHSANSGAIIDMPETHMDMVRAGISVYGLYPSREVHSERIDLQPAMALKARIVHIKQVQQGSPISYGSTWRAPKPTTIATVPIGYGDGYSRLLSNRGQVLVHGRRAPIVGRVCMDLSMIDVGHIDNVQISDEVVLFGQQREAAITADEVADAIGTINYEITTSLTSRVPRVYINLSNQ